MVEFLFVDGHDADLNGAHRLVKIDAERDALDL